MLIGHLSFLFLHKVPADYTKDQCSALGLITDLDLQVGEH